MLGTSKEKRRYWIDWKMHSMLNQCYAEHACFFFLASKPNHVTTSWCMGHSYLSNTSLDIFNCTILSLRLLLFAFMILVLFVNSVGISRNRWLRCSR